MPLRRDDPAGELSLTVSVSGDSPAYYSQLARLLLQAELRTQAHNYLNEKLGLNLPPADLKRVREDDRPFDDLPGKNPISAFANLASMIVGGIRPPKAMTYAWGPEGSTGSMGQLRLANDGLPPEVFDRERVRLELMQWDIARLVSRNLGPMGIDPLALLPVTPEATALAMAQDLSHIVQQTQQSANREPPSATGAAKLGYWKAEPATTQQNAGIDTLAGKLDAIGAQADRILEGIAAALTLPPAPLSVDLPPVHQSGRPASGAAAPN